MLTPSCLLRMSQGTNSHHRANISHKLLTLYQFLPNIGHFVLNVVQAKAQTLVINSEIRGTLIIAGGVEKFQLNPQNVCTFTRFEIRKSIFIQPIVV